MATPDRDNLANGLVSIGEEAVAKSNDALFYDYYTDDYRLHSPAGDFDREEIRAYFAALRESFTDFTISRAQILVDGNFATSRTVMAGRFDKEFAYTPIGAVGRLRHLARRVPPLQPLIDQTLRVLAALRLTVDRVARGEEARRHVPAHVAEADKAHARACRRHLAHLPELVARSPSVTSSLSGRLACRV
jgi:SnoaL-like protein